MTETTEVYRTHLPGFQETAFIKGYEEYKALHQKSLENPDSFWAEQAEKHLSWYQTWDHVLEYDFPQGKISWFGGAKLNATYNCLDRHLDAIGEKTAYFWEGDDPNQSLKLTYKELYQLVNKAAAAFKAKGLKKGDRVVIYMPMVPELAVAMLACARLGVVHSIVFGGFSAESLANRINDCGAKMVITADGSFRAGKTIPLKNAVDAALPNCPEVENILVLDRCGLGLELGEKESWWHEVMADPSLPDYVEPEPMDAEDPLFILYTSGSTGKPKGVVHTHGGYLLYAAMTTRITFDLKDDEVFWCTADIGWITGHTYLVYGPLINGLTGLIFEGVPSYPGFDRFWQVVEKYQVNKFYTAPTVIRSVAKEGAAMVDQYDLSSLRLLGTVGEPINPEAWRWYYEHVGKSRCPIVDTWWQTETGGHMMTPLPGVHELKPGSCAQPFFGVDPVIIDPDTGEPAKYPNQEGVLCIRKPWPGMARTVFGDHKRFIETYFSQVPGMYFTGDGAKFDEDGYFWIIGRIDDVINVSGHRLGTAEIESALVAHRDVAEAAVVGFPHQVKGQGIYAFVTLNTGVEKTDEIKKELVKMVRAEIGPVATPDVIQWADALPKTRSGKILRRMLQKIAAGNVEEMGDTTTIADPSVLEQLIKERVANAA